MHDASPLDQLRFDRDDRLCQYCAVLFSSFYWRKCRKKLSTIIPAVDWVALAKGDIHLTAEQLELFFGSVLPKFNKRRKYFCELFGVKECPSADIFADPNGEAASDPRLSGPESLEALSPVPQRENPPVKKVRSVAPVAPVAQVAPVAPKRKRKRSGTDDPVLLEILPMAVLSEVQQAKLLIACQGRTEYLSPILVKIPPGTFDVTVHLVFREEVVFRGDTHSRPPNVPNESELGSELSLELVHRRALFFLVYLASKIGANNSLPFDSFPDDSALDMGFSEVTGSGDSLASQIRLGIAAATSGHIADVTEHFQAWYSQSEEQHLRLKSLAPNVESDFAALLTAPLSEHFSRSSHSGNGAVVPRRRKRRSGPAATMKNLARCLREITPQGSFDEAILQGNGKRGVCVTFHTSTGTPHTEIIDVPDETIAVGYAIARQAVPLAANSTS